MLQVAGIDEEGRLALQIWFDPEDIDAAIAELDALHARFEEERSQAGRLFGGRELPSAPASYPNAGRRDSTPRGRASDRRVMAAVQIREAWDEVEQLSAPASVSVENRRKIVGFARVHFPSSEYGSVRQGLTRQAVPIVERGYRRARRASGSHPTGAEAPPTRTLAHRRTKRSNYSASTRTVESPWRCGSTSKTSTPPSPNLTRSTPGSKRYNLERRSRTPRVEPTIGSTRFSRPGDWDAIGRTADRRLRVDDRRRGLRREGNDRAAAFRRSYGRSPTSEFALKQ